MSPLFGRELFRREDAFVLQQREAAGAFHRSLASKYVDVVYSFERRLVAMVDNAQTKAAASTEVDGAEYFRALAAEGVLKPGLLRIHVGMVIQTRSADRVFEDIYKDHGFSNREFEVLICSYAWGDKYKRPGALAEFLGMSPGGLTAVLDRLESRGLITRSVAKDDGRSRWIEPTDEGLRLADLGLRSQLEWIETHIGSTLNDEQQDVFLELLDKLLGASSPGYEPPPGE